MRTLLLNQADWDLCVDAAGNIAICDIPYAQAQDVASAIKLFLGELWYDTTKGVPYWQDILGHFPPVPIMKADWVKAALTVPGITAAVVFITGATKREVFGQVQVRNDQGAQLTVGASQPIASGFFFAITESGTPGITDSGQRILVG